MRQSEGYILRRTADLTVILPVGEASVRFPGMISVNETGAFLWGLLETQQTPDTLAQAMTREYEVELPQAQRDVESFLEQLRKAGAVTED